MDNNQRGSIDVNGDYGYGTFAENVNGHKKTYD